MKMNIQLSDANLTRLTAHVENGTYPSLDSAANALIERALNLELPETVKYDSDRLAMGLGGKEHLDSVFAMIIKQGLLRNDWLPFDIQSLIERLPQSVQETITPNMRRLLGGKFQRWVRTDYRISRVGYTSPARYKRNRPEQLS